MSRRSLGTGEENRLSRRAALKTGLLTALTVGLGLSVGQVSASSSRLASTAGVGTANGGVRTQAVGSGVPSNLQSKLTADDGDGDDTFGAAVAVDGDIAIVGAPDDEDPNGSEGGSAYVYVRSGGTWTEQEKLVPGDGDGGDGFGTSVAVDGSTAVVGAPNDEDPNGTDGGSAYVFVQSGGSWSQETKLAAGDGAGGDLFGWTVDIDGDTAVVGARDATTQDPNLGTVNAGATYVYTRSGTSWSLQEKLLVSDQPNDDMVSSVAIDGNTLVVGDGGDSETGGDVSGAAYVFTRSSGNWSQPTKFTAGDNDKDDNFGTSVDIDGDTVVAGAPGEESSDGKFAGAAYVFVRDSGNWPQEAKLTAGTRDSGDQFGDAVAVYGDTVVVGVPSDEDPDSGSAHVFTRSGSSWSAESTLVPSDGDSGDDIGAAVGLHDGTLVAGAPGDDDKGTDAGAAYVYVGNEPPKPVFNWSPDPIVPGQPATFDASASSDPDGSIETYEWDFDGDGNFEVSTSSPTTTYTFGSGGRYDVTLRVTDDDGAAAVVTGTVTVLYEVDVAVKPGGRGAKPINPRSRGLLPVAVLTDSEFDPVATADRSTIRFGDPDDVGFTGSGNPTGGASVAHGGHVEDVDNDGDDDLMLHFPTRAADFDGEDTEAKLVGLTDNGVPFVGTDNIRIVGRGGK